MQKRCRQIIDICFVLCMLFCSLFSGQEPDSFVAVSENAGHSVTYICVEEPELLEVGLREPELLEARITPTLQLAKRSAAGRDIRLSVDLCVQSGTSVLFCFFVAAGVFLSWKQDRNAVLLDYIHNKDGKKRI